MSVSWTIKSFEDLTVSELYEVLQLRIDIFMLEQNCLYRECDDLDISAWHLLGKYENKIIAYARLLPAGLSYKEPAIGRVLVKREYRRSKTGTQLMQEAINFWRKQEPTSAIRISAQLYLKTFYEGLGFEIASNSYLEDNIPHVHMLKHYK